MVVGGIDRQYLQPYSVANQNYNNNSLREIIERPVKLATATGTPETTAFSSYWDVPTTGDAAIQQQAVEAARIYNQASLKIMLVYNTDGTIDTTNTVIRGQTPDGMADGPPITGADYTNIMASLNTSTGGKRFPVIDIREGGTSQPVQTTSVDVGALRTAILGMSSTFNGILYIADVTGEDPSTLSYNNGMTTTNTNGTDFETVGGVSTGARVMHAIMLTNGSNVPGSQIVDTTDPLRAFTVATENGIYIKGDYNTGGIAGNVPSNSGSPTADTFAAGYTPVTSAVMADSVAILSSRFNPTAGGDGYFTQTHSTINPAMTMAMDPVTGLEVDPTTSGAVSATTRAAVSTTVNTAVVSGIYENTATQVGGGASNLLRYMENWGQVPTQYSNTATGPTTASDYSGGITSTSVTYKGSLMQSFFSKELTAPWRGASGGTYNAPTRIVRFDDSFINKPPAGFPATITYVKGAWERLL